MKIPFFLLILLLPTQLGRHFWPSFSFIQGIRVDYLSPTIYLTDIIATWLIVTWLITKFSTFTPERPSFASFQLSIFRKHWLLVVLVFIGSIGIYSSQSPLSGIYGLVKIIEFILVGFITANLIKTKNDFNSVVNLLTVGVVFESALAIMQFVKQGSVGGILWFLGERTFTASTVGIANAVVDGQLLLRPYGTFSHPNVLAGFLVVVMSLIILNRHSLLLIISLAVGTLALILTMSRVAILIWLLVFGWWFIVYFKRKAILISAVFVALIFIGSIATGRGFSISEESFVRRQELATAALSMVKNSPLWGVGLNNFLVNLPAFQQTKSTILYLQPVHNIYLLILAETGIVGFVFFVWFIWKTIRKLRTTYYLLLTTLFVIFFLGLFDHYFLTLEQGQLLLTLILGLCWSKIRVGKR